MSKSCPTYQELLALSERDLSERQREEIERHLGDCATCKASFAALRASVEALGETAEEHREVDLVAAVHRGLARDDLETQTRGRWLANARFKLRILSLSAVAAVAALVIAVRPGVEQAPDGMRAKSASNDTEASAIAIATFRVTGAGAVPVDGELGPNEPLVFTYLNHAINPFEYLMLFAVDQQGEVHWYYPAYTEAGSDPVSIRIAAAAQSTPLPEQVRQHLPAGDLAIYGLFSRTPLQVSAIESWAQARHAAGASLASAPEQSPFAGTAQHVLPLQVRER